MVNIDKLKIYKKEALEKKENHEDFLEIKISNKDSIVFYTFKGESDKTLFASHQYCGGDMVIRNIELYTLIHCRKCSLRKEIPTYIKTITDLTNYFKEIKYIHEKDKQSRFELMDIE